MNSDMTDFEKAYKKTINPSLKIATAYSQLSELRYLAQDFQDREPEICNQILATVAELKAHIKNLDENLSD